MQTRFSDEHSIRLSVCLSLKRMYCDKTEERYAQIFMAYERSFSLLFLEEEWLVGGVDPFYVQFLVNVLVPVRAKLPIFNRYSP